MCFMPFYCPRCAGVMIIEKGEVRFSRAPNPVIENFVICLECPEVSQIQEKGGKLLDVPGWTLVDLRYPPPGEEYQRPGPGAKLIDRRDS